ncbi:hypothetical protein HAX54_021892 [Datura stramonium]|uniref:HD-Zip IV C-terminal domain-containing protein n=1 Tax=Datura stramonium TaxID=4076 RepID=A0ABS8S5X4_DATST|nr:hypothetical protein [Datura stramonium]
MAMREALENIYCPQCDGPPIGEEERERNIEKMKMENQMLRDEYEEYQIHLRVVGRSFLMNPPNSTLGSPSNSSDESEMVELFQVNNPIWIKSPSDERCFIHRDSYDRIFSNPNRPYKSSLARIESSRDYGVKWMNMFPTIVTKARSIEVLDATENLGGSIQLLNSGDRFSIRKNEEITQPKGFIATASTSLCLPLSFQTIFNFFKDHKTRPQWDVLTDGNNVIELAQNCLRNFSENSITIIQPFVPKENNMLVLQESSIVKWELS